MAKKTKIREAFLAELRKVPIVQVACEKVGISRNSAYRWKREDKEFAKEMEEALAEGEALVNDMSESQLLTLIKEKSFSAIRFWLNHRNPKYKDKVEIDATVTQKEHTLTPEQQKVVDKALKHATSEHLSDTDEKDKKDNVKSTS